MIMDSTHHLEILKYQRRELRRVRTCNALGWCVAILSVASLTFGLILLIVFIAVDPKIPTFHIHGATISTLIIHKLSSNESKNVSVPATGDYYSYRLAATVNLQFDAENPNAKHDIFFKRIHVELDYWQLPIANATLPMFVLPHKSNVSFGVLLVQPLLLLKQTQAYTLKADNASDSINFVVEMQALMKLATVGHLRSPKSWVKVRCAIIVSAVNDPSGSQLLDSQCRYRY